MSVGAQVLRDLIGGPYRRKAPYYVIIMLLLSALATSAWIVWGDLSQRNGGKEEDAVALGPTVAELGQADWRVGELVPAKGSSVFTAKVVDARGQAIFDLNVDGTTGELLARPEEAQAAGDAAGSAATPLDTESLRARVAKVLPMLALGQAKVKEGGRFLEAPLTYQSRQVATIRVDPRTDTIVAKGEGAVRSRGPEEREGGRARLVAGNLVQPLGWLAATLAIVSTLYYSWRRAQTAIIRESPGGAKAPAIRRLRLVLRWHEVFGVLALGLATLHLVNFWGRLQVSTSWLLFFMMITVVLSGLFRDVMGQYQVVRTYWRSFHIPYTLLFFAVMVVHVLMKVELLGND
ncbi:MAG: DUF4405 domain-containing protein [Chloroflexi bacterium]|nr:DUF4405 domain-containing protein [Chloroflexota bacterium]